MKVTLVGSNTNGHLLLVDALRGLGVESQLYSSVREVPSPVSGSVIHLLDPGPTELDAISECDVPVMVSMWWGAVPIDDPRLCAATHVFLGREFGETPSFHRWSWQAFPSIVPEVILPSSVGPTAHFAIAHELSDNPTIAEAFRSIHEAGISFSSSILASSIDWESVPPYAVVLEAIDREWFGEVAIEALARGHAVLSGNAPESKHLWQQLNFSPVFHTTSDNLEKRITAIAREPRCLRDLAIRGRKYIDTYHHPRRIAERLVEIYLESATQ